MSKRKASRAANSKALVIVESPAKARTINKYLGRGFVVKASMGHVRDLPKSDFGIDLTDGFRPTYEIVRGRTKVISDLKKLAAKAKEVFLATDRDREGEAIAWHLVQALGLPPEKVRRVIFNEITKTAIGEAFAHPHQIDVDRVNAQQARRVLDRIVGYQLSPLLWRKIAKGLSAGRVQSVTVRLIVDREREIRELVPKESWKVVAYVGGDAEAAARLAAAWKEFSAQERTQKDIQKWLSEHAAFRAELAEVAGEPFKARDADAVANVVGALGYNLERIERRHWDEYSHLGLEQAELVGEFDRARGPRLVVSELSTKPTTNRPPAPFTTAALQQQASTVLRFSNSRTMRIAQALYEGIDLNGEGPVGLITYMRTDSSNLANEAVVAVRDFIKQHYGDRYLPERPNVYAKRQSRAQEAHEAIRPTDPRRTPESVRKALSADQYKLYDLIWKRFVACQMPPAQWDSTTVSLSCETALGPARFTGSGRKLVFDGFMRVAGLTSEDQILPPLEQGSAVGILALEPKQQFTSPPPRYTEASLVKALESGGIGRPSTYATIIETIQQRGYVEQVERRFHPTSLGEVVTEKLVRHFPKILDVKFTSHMEDELDKIEEAHFDWVHVLQEFYDPFKELLARAGEEMEVTRSQPSKYNCPLCESPMVYRWGKMGRFLSCSQYPDCKGTLNVNRDGEPLVPEEGARNCELCGKSMVLRQSRTGFFLGCRGYPDCRNTIACDENGRPLQLVEEQDLRQRCEACGEGTLTVKWKGRRAFLGCDRYPRCKNTAPIPPEVRVKRKPAPAPEETGILCDTCRRPMVIRTGSRGKFIACSGFPKCRNTKPFEKLEELRAVSAGQDRSSGAGTEGQNTTNTSTVETSSAVQGGAAAFKGKAGENGSVVEQFGEPPPGFAWTRTGRPVVETMPEHGKLVCPQCSDTMELKRGRFGPFFSCSNFPRCKFVSNLRGEAKKLADELLPRPTKPRPIPTDIPCEACGAPMLVRQGPRGKFLGCSAYPKCKSTQALPEGFQVPAVSDKG
ncbi:MAG: type I DNA topoisomerase [Phycisphaerae bacterium]